MTTGTGGRCASARASCLERFGSRMGGAEALVGHEPGVAGEHRLGLEPEPPQPRGEQLGRQPLAEREQPVAIRLDDRSGVSGKPFRLGAPGLEQRRDHGRVDLDRLRELDVAIDQPLRQIPAPVAVAGELDQQVGDAGERADDHDRIAIPPLGDEPRREAEVVGNADRGAAEFEDQHERSGCGTSRQCTSDRLAISARATSRSKRVLAPAGLAYTGCATSRPSFEEPPLVTRTRHLPRLILVATALAVVAVDRPFLGGAINGPAREHKARGEREAGPYPSDWFGMQRAFPFATIPQKKLAIALEETRLARVERSLSAAAIPLTWTQAGPFNIGGRVTAIAGVPGASTVYLAAANGGVFRSTNGGTNWTPVFDDWGSTRSGRSRSRPPTRTSSTSAPASPTPRSTATTAPASSARPTAE